MPTSTDTPIRDGIATTREGMKAQVPAELLAQFDAQADALAADSFAQRAPQPGDQAPRFELSASDGSITNLDALLAEGPVVLAFYRGDWCPYCNVQLRAYQDALPALTERGARLVAISPQSADHGRQLTTDAGLEFAVLTDEGADVAEAYGLAFAVSELDQAPFDAAGIDIKGSSAGGDWRLPTPGTFVLDTDGTVLLASVDGDFRRRAEPAQLLAALDARRS